jgi:hypothetical protein
MTIVIPLTVLPEITAPYSEHDDISSGINARSNNPDSDYKRFWYVKTDSQNKTVLWLSQWCVHCRFSVQNTMDWKNKEDVHWVSACTLINLIHTLFTSHLWQNTIPHSTLKKSFLQTLTPWLLYKGTSGRYRKEFTVPVFSKVTHKRCIFSPHY